MRWIGFAFYCLGWVLVSAAEYPVTVYVMDNGVRIDHEVFKATNIKTVDLTGARKGERIIDQEPYGDHATFLAGLILERAPAAELVSVRTLDQKGNGKWSEFIRGVHWITNHHPDGAPAVANLSLGGLAKDPRVEKLVVRAIDQLVEDGVTVVVAGGNDGTDEEDRIPSTMDSVISVGAVSMFDARLDSSNYGSCVDVYALGKGLEGPGSFSRVYRTQESGTSTAAAVVTGHIANFLSGKPEATPEEVKDWLLTNSPSGKVKNIPEGQGHKALLFEGR